MINAHHYVFKSIEDKVDDIKGGTITDVEILNSGKVCIFIKKDGRDYALDCTGERVVVNAYLTLEEEVAHLKGVLSALIQATGVSDEKLMEIMAD